MRLPWVVRLINIGAIYAAFSAWYWLVGPELSKIEAIALTFLGAALGQFMPFLPPDLLTRGRGR